MYGSEFTSNVSLTVAPFGELSRSEAYLALGQANQAQRVFNFRFDQKLLSFDLQKYVLPNGGYELDRAAREMLANTEYPKPLILLTSLPYGDTDHPNEPDYFYFADYQADFDHDVTIISSYLWNKLDSERRLAPYVLLSLATIALMYCSGLELHDESHGCFLDYCDDPLDFDLCIKAGKLCDNCESYLQVRLRSGRACVEQIAASKRLFNRAMGQKTCFMIMPFQPALKKVYEIVCATLEAKGWLVIRGDELVHPRRIPDAILQAILVSDLVVADLSGHNPNVFYELGVAHATHADVILLSQDEIPFDVNMERAIFYKPSRPGLQKLKTELDRFVGSGSW